MISSQEEKDQSTLEILAYLSYRSGEIKPYLQQLAQGLSELLGLDWSVVTLCHNDKERILASSVDLGAAGKEIYSLHGTLTSTVFNSGCPLMVEDAITCDDYGKPPDGYRAYLGVPLRTPTGKLIGTVCSFQAQPRQFQSQELKLAELFAERAAIAIDNYQLYQKQRRFNQRLEAEVAKRTQELAQAKGKLEELNTNLELLVEQRTTQLQQANQKLQEEINERTEAEVALRLSEERFRTLVDNAADAFFVVNPEGKIIDVNQCACESLGYTREELLKLSITDIQTQLSREKIKEFRQQVDQGKPVTVEGEHQRKDGTTFPVEVRATPFERGKQHLHLALVRDISERKQALKALERLAEVGELAAMIVHEVRNPLATIWIGLTSLKRMDLPSRAKMRLSIALEEGQRLQRLLNEILLYAKPQQLQAEEVDIKSLMTETLASLSTLPTISEREIKFISQGENIQVRGDGDKLKQVVINLVTNACEAVTPEETVSITIKPIKNYSWTRLQVHNGGEPISPEVLPKLTKPFFTTKSAGNGLGLAIVKRIIEAHGGELGIESNATDGTTVTVNLPTFH